MVTSSNCQVLQLTGILSPEAATAKQNGHVQTPCLRNGISNLLAVCQSNGHGAGPQACNAHGFLFLLGSFPRAPACHEPRFRNAAHGLL